MGRVPDTLRKDPLDACGANTITLINGVVSLTAAGLACLGVRHLVSYLVLASLNVRPRSCS